MSESSCAFVAVRCGVVWMVLWSTWDLLSSCHSVLFWAVLHCTSSRLCGLCV